MKLWLHRIKDFLKASIFSLYIPFLLGFFFMPEEPTVWTLLFGLSLYLLSVAFVYRLLRRETAKARERQVARIEGYRDEAAEQWISSSGDDEERRRRSNLWETGGWTVAGTAIAAWSMTEDAAAFGASQVNINGLPMAGDSGIDIMGNPYGTFNIHNPGSVDPFELVAGFDSSGMGFDHGSGSIGGFDAFGSSSMGSSFDSGMDSFGSSFDSSGFDSSSSIDHGMDNHY